MRLLPRTTVFGSGISRLFAISGSVVCRSLKPITTCFPVHAGHLEPIEVIELSLTVLPNCGHCPNEEDPELLTRELVAFWKSG